MEKYNENFIRKHYEWLSHKTESEIRIITPDKKALSQSIHNIEELLTLCKKHSGINHIYIGINERKPKGTKITDIETINNFVIDIDNKKDFIETHQVALKIKDTAVEQGFKEPLLITSGNGVHLYFAMCPIPNTIENREKIKAIGKRFKEKYENEFCLIDDAVFEVARVMRLAGTMNVKPEVNAMCSIVNSVKRDDDKKFTDELLSIKQDNSNYKVNSLESWIIELIEEDYNIKNLFEGNFSGFESRSEGEESLVCRLIRAGLDKEQIFRVMASCKIGKWQESHIQYRELTYKKAVEIINKEKLSDKNKNPFKKLHYKTQHLPCFDELNSSLGLYGKHYLPIKKARWYQLLGGILQKQIKLGEKFTDTRINCIYPLPTEQGKNDLIYLNKNIVSKIKKEDELYTIEEPISYHPEQLIGKVIEVMIDNPNGSKPKKIKVKQENRGYFNADFVEIDEANSLIYGTDEQTRQAREYISKALNPIGRNEVVKKLVEDLPDERVSYFPNCTFSLYIQPKKIDEILIHQGFLRRFLIPVGKIAPFLNYGNEEDFKRKVNSQNRINKNEDMTKYLESVKKILKDKYFIFTDDGREKINYYLQFLIAEGQVHSEKIANLTKLTKWTVQDYLIKMSCILAGSYETNIVTEDHVALAFMDLVELLQSTFDFIKEWVVGNFDYGVSWKGADYKAQTCLEYLYEKNCFSLENSSVSIFEFQNYIKEIYGVKDTRAGQIFAGFKKNEWVKSKQIGTTETRVWLGFIPEIEKLADKGHMGDKGFILYNNIVLGLNDIFTRVLPLRPLRPMNQDVQQ